MQHTVTVVLKFFNDIRTCNQSKAKLKQRRLQSFGFENNLTKWTDSLNAHAAT